MRQTVNKGTEDSPAQKVFDSLWELEKQAHITDEDRKVLERARHMVNAQEVINYQMVNACKRAGFVYDDSQREGVEWQAFMWLQDKGLEAFAANAANSNLAMVRGVESRIEELLNFIQGFKDAS